MVMDQYSHLNVLALLLQIFICNKIWGIIITGDLFVTSNFYVNKLTIVWASGKLDNNFREAKCVYVSQNVVLA